MLDAVRREGRIKSIQILLDHAGEVKTDLPLGQMASLANRAYQVPDSGVEFYLLPGRGTYHNGYSVYEVDREALADLLNEAFRRWGRKFPHPSWRWPQCRSRRLSRKNRPVRKNNP